MYQVHLNFKGQGRCARWQKFTSPHSKPKTFCYIKCQYFSKTAPIKNSTGVSSKQRRLEQDAAIVTRNWALTAMAAQCPSDGLLKFNGVTNITSGLFSLKIPQFWPWLEWCSNAATLWHKVCVNHTERGILQEAWHAKVGMNEFNQ